MTLFQRLSPAAVLVVAAGVLLAAPRAAEAADAAAAQAEHTRLSEEMRKLASRNAWMGVEKGYLNMLNVEKQGAVLTYDDHMLGAQAARALGDTTAVYDRLLRARSKKKTDEVAAWIADIEGSYGRVELLKDVKWAGTLTLTPDEMPFAPDQRAVIAVAFEAIKTKGEYKGLLPFGGYSLAGQHFEVKPGGELAVAALKAEGKSGNKVQTHERRDGLRFDLGPLYSVVGDPKTDEGPEGFSGYGVRAGLGWEVELARPVGLVLQAGYQGTLAGSANEPAELYGTTVNANAKGDSLHLFFVSGGVAVWPTKNLSISVGPSWSIGGAHITGAPAGGCLEGQSAVACENATAEATVMPVGGSAGLFYGFAGFPGMKRSRSGVSLNGGAVADSTRLYPWAQLAFTIAPSS
jgi:hypothetical protein